MLYTSLATKYKSIEIDSALIYINLASDLADDIKTEPEKGSIYSVYKDIAIMKDNLNKARNYYKCMS